jgi:ribosomal-protein-alanine N-acetyltransferase
VNEIAPLRLELARVRDAAEIASLSQRVVEAGMPQISWNVERAQRAIRDRERTVLVARPPGLSITGVAIMRFRDTSAHLELLAVEPDMQRRSLGRRLLTWLEESAQVAGTFTIRLELRASNLRALAFYRSLGYAEYTRAPRYYCGIEDAIRMMRDLRVAP